MRIVITHRMTSGIAGCSATPSGSMSSPHPLSEGKKSSLRFDFSPPVTQARCARPFQGLDYHI